MFSIVTFDTSGHDGRFAFAHGQHVNLRRQFDGVEVRRSYSICSPAPDGALRIAIRQVAEHLEKLMPPGRAPLALFRTVAHNPRVLGRLRRGGLRRRAAGSAARG